MINLNRNEKKRKYCHSNDKQIKCTNLMNVKIKPLYFYDKIAIYSISHYLII
jgi:hypothetical protein